MLFAPKNLLITGGAGFIGSALVRHVLAAREGAPTRVVVLDALTYAGHRVNLEGSDADPRFVFVNGDICDAELVNRVMAENAIDSVLHLAAETHVDRSIESAQVFVRTNVVGTLTLLDACLRAWKSAAGSESSTRFVHVSTDEVYGALGETGFFTEETPYAPNSPYAASKASSDLLARSFHRTYGLPVIVTNTCNNYGPRQLPEKLLPLMISNAADGKKLPVYGRGKQVREWLHVDDHCEALYAALLRGTIGESYNFGSGEERSNLELVEALADVVDAREKKTAGTSRALITFVEDRKGHDFRYAIDSSKAARTLGWKPARTLAQELPRLVDWYLTNRAWREKVSSDEHARFQDAYYANRAGAKA